MFVTVTEVDESAVVVAPHVAGGVAWMRLTRPDGDVPEPGMVIDVEIDGTDWIFEVVAGVTADRCRVQVVSRPGMTFRLPGGDELDLAGCGVPAAFKGQAARQLRFWRLPAGMAVPGHFDHPDVGRWVREQEKARQVRDAAERKAAQLRRRARMLAESQDHFVNPYTFVPFPSSRPPRGEPAGHHVLGTDSGVERFQGTITARLEARSPLLVRNVAGRPADGGVATAARDGRGELFIPGSSLHGAIRSLHETLTGSCLRVFDPDFVPVYRDVASGALRTGWGLGVVVETDDVGRPTQLLRCTETKWVDLRILNKAQNPIATGDRFRLPGTFERRGDREIYQQDDAAVADADGDWVVLVSDSSVPRQPFRCAVGRLSQNGPRVRLTDRAWIDFRAAAAGAKQHHSGRGQARPDLAEERRRLTQGEGLAKVLGAKVDRVYGDATWLRPRAWLHAGQVVWLAPPSGGYVPGVALSYLWRTAGQGDAGARLPRGLEPCHDAMNLCPTCTVFGSADTRDASETGVDRRVAEQNSYRGHVRVLDAVLESGGVLPEPVTLPAAGQPRPGSGQFYLSDPRSGREKLEYQRPRNRWGVPDPTEPRTLRGRKFYWHTDPDVDERRGRWRRHDHAPERGEQAELVARGSVYSLRLIFDGLTRVQVGGLVAALQPDRLFAARPDPLPYPTENPAEFAIHVGGGKPIGLGSCRVRDLTVTVDDAGSRYLGSGASQAPDPDELVVEFAARHGERLDEVWRDTAAALHTDHVDSRIVGYPTALSWADAEGGCAGKRQHESFAWFQQTTGEGAHQGPDKPFVALPAVSDIAPALPVHPRGQR